LQVASFLGRGHVSSAFTHKRG